nr:RDD family protein [Thiomicrorhabdus sp.]
MQAEEKTATEMESPELPEAIEYAGFWIRVMATLIDSVIVMIITLPIITAIYGEVPRDGYTYLQGGWDLVINYLFPAVAVIVFWIYKSATPGKLLTKISIVDAKTGGKPS